MTDATSPAETAVRRYFDAYSQGRPDLFDQIVAPDYLDHGHTPPGRGPQGARDDYEHAVQATGGITTYTIDALVTQHDTVAVVWTGALPGGAHLSGLSLYLVRDGLVAEIRHTTLGDPPA